MKRIALLVAFCFYWSTLPAFAATPVIGELIVKNSPEIHVKAYMDGQAGRPTLAGWQANQTGTNCTLALQAAVDAAGAIDNGAKVVLPDGVCRIALDNLVSLGDVGGTERFTAVLIDHSNITIEGQGPSSVLYIPEWATYIGGSPSVANFIQAGSMTENLTNIHFRNFRVLGDFPQTDNTLRGNEVAAAIAIGPASPTTTLSNSGIDHVSFEKTGLGVQFGGGQAPGTGIYCDRNYATNLIFYNTSGGGLNAISGGHQNTILSHMIFSKVGGNYAIEWASAGVLMSDMIFNEVWGGAIVTEFNPAATLPAIIKNIQMDNVGQYEGQSGTQSSPAIQLSEGMGGQRTTLSDIKIQNSYGQCLYLASAADNVFVDNFSCEGFGINGTTRTLGAGTVFAGIDATNRKQIRITNSHVSCNNAATDNCQYGFIVGGSLAEDNYTDGNTTRGTFSVAPFYLPTSVGRNGTGTRVFVGKNLDLKTGNLAGALEGDGDNLFPTTIDNDATPDVSGSNVWFLNNTGVTSITMLDGGYPGMIVTLMCSNGNTTLVHSASFDLAGASNFVCTANDIITLLKYSDVGGGVWFEVSRSVN